MGRTDSGDSQQIMSREGQKQFPAGEGGLDHPQATYMSPKLFLLLVCLKFPLRDNIPKTFLFGIAEVGWFIFSICFELTRGSKPTFKGKLSLLFLSLGAHLDTRCMNYCPAQSAFLMETCLFVEISSLVVS
jgi:hypothetical protein